MENLSGSELKEWILENVPDEEFLFADGFDEAILGYCERNFVIIYSTKKCIDILIQDEEMTAEDALEHFYYNVSGSYVGEKTPIFCNDNTYY